MRTDLLSLSLEDLIDLCNRGLVNRSLKEVDAGTLTATIVETADGSLEFQWSDGVTCSLPSQTVLNSECCSCNATQICRHLLRSILYYQRMVRERGQGTEELSSEGLRVDPEDPEAIGFQVAPNVAPDVEPGIRLLEVTGQEWDPGEIGDAVLESYFKPTEWKRLQEQFAQGQILELSRGAKPTAYFHQWGVTTRFQVPGDVRYVYCSCGEAEERVCTHVPLAVWGFRSLRQQFPRQSTGLISTEIFEPMAPALLLELEGILGQVLSLGLTHWSTPLLGRIKRWVKTCETAGWVWLSELWGDVLQQHTYYQAQDAQFQPSLVTELLMEGECRLRAMQNPESPVPQLWIRGSALDRPATIGATTLVGLGCGVRVGQGAVQLQVYVQDLKSGQVLIINHPEKAEGGSGLSFAQLALKSGFKRFALARLGSHQLVIKGGKRLPNQEFRPARNTPASLNPQTFAWENNLRPPLLVDDFQLLQEHLAQCPPPALRPRRLGDRFQVMTIAGVRGAVFSTIEQCILADLIDPHGNRISLRHPYHDRGAEGAEILLNLLQSAPHQFRFVSGLVSQGSQGLEIQPIALIVENTQGQRSMLQPWIETRQTWSGLTGLELSPADRLESCETFGTAEAIPGSTFSAQSPTLSATPDPLTSYLEEVKALITDLLLLGLESSDRHLSAQLPYLCERGRFLGFHQLLAPVETLAAEFSRKANDRHWQSDRSGQAVRELLLWLSFAPTKSG